MLLQGINWRPLVSTSPGVLFAVRACVGILERGSSSASFSGLLSLFGNYLAGNTQLHLVSLMCGPATPNLAVWCGAQPWLGCCLGSVPQTPFRPHLLPMAAPYWTQVPAHTGKGIEPHQPW